MSKATLKGIAQFNAHKNKDLSWDEWQEKYPEAIEAMEETDPQAFGALYLAEFGVNPGGDRYNPRSVSEESKNTFTANAKNNWNWDQWQTNAPSGLEAMQVQDPVKFQALYHAEFGVVPRI